MKSCCITVRDEVHCTITGLQPQEHEFLYQKFSLMVEGAHFMPKFKLGLWDGRIQFFSEAGKMYTRLLSEVLPYLEQCGYATSLVDQRRPCRPIETRIDESWFLNRPNVDLKVRLRPYQVDAVNACLDATSGFVNAATGSGKTLMIAALADVMAQSGRRTIVIVPSADLVEQTAGTFRLVQLDVGVYSGGTKDVEHPVVVATWQALQNNPGLMREFEGEGEGGCLVVDECHGIRADVVSKLINTYGNQIAYRFGFTGTMPKPLIDRTILKGSIGDVLYEIPAALLIEQGYLARLEIEPVETEDDVTEEFPDYGSEKTFLGRSPKRLDFLADLIIAKAQEHGNTFVLVSSIKQGKALQKLIKSSVFLYGKSDGDVRAEWYSTFEDRDDLIVIATFGIASVGISIDRIFCGIMIDAGKSFVRSIQSIGRTLRRGHDKDRVHVLDVHSRLRWSRKHFRERATYYREAQYPVLKTVKMKLSTTPP